MLKHFQADPIQLVTNPNNSWYPTHRLPNETSGLMSRSAAFRPALYGTKTFCFGKVQRAWANFAGEIPLGKKPGPKKSENGLSLVTRGRIMIMLSQGFDNNHYVKFLRFNNICRRSIVSWVHTGREVNVWATLCNTAIASDKLAKQIVDQIVTTTFVVATTQLLVTTGAFDISTATATPSAELVDYIPYATKKSIGITSKTTKAQMF